MSKLKVDVTAIDKESFPGFVQFEFVDYFGITLEFSEKLPVLEIEVHEVPYFAWIDCVVLEQKQDSVMISTDRSNGIESRSGQFEFEVKTEIVRFNG